MDLNHSFYSSNQSEYYKNNPNWYASLFNTVMMLGMANAQSVQAQRLSEKCGQNTTVIMGSFAPTKPQNKDSQLVPVLQDNPFQIDTQREYKLGQIEEVPDEEDKHISQVYQSAIFMGNNLDTARAIPLQTDIKPQQSTLKKIIAKVWQIGETPGKDDPLTARFWNNPDSNRQPSTLKRRARCASPEAKIMGKKVPPPPQKPKSKSRSREPISREPFPISVSNTRKEASVDKTVEQNIKSMGMIYSDDDEGFVMPLSLHKRNLYLQLQQSDDKTVQLKSMVKQQKTEAKEPKGEDEQSLISLEQSITIEVAPFQSEEPPINFESEGFRSKIVAAVQQVEQEYLENSEKLYKFNMRLFMYTEKEIILEVPEAIDAFMEADTPGYDPKVRSPKSQNYEKAWQKQLKSLDVTSEQFNQLNKEASSKLVNLMVDEYLEKWNKRQKKHKDGAEIISSAMMPGIIYEVQQKYEKNAYKIHQKLEASAMNRFKADVKKIADKFMVKLKKKKKKPKENRQGSPEDKILSAEEDKTDNLSPFSDLSA